jgi:hypothetical protein
MLVLIAIENGVKKIIPLTADAGAGNPVGTVIVVCSNQIPSNYLPLGTQYDTSLYPVLYALLGTDTTPTASALGLPTLTSGQYAIKATSGLSENAQDNVINTLNEQRSYSTEEHLTGRKWIDGKDTYEITFYSATNWANYAVIGNIPNIDTIVSIKDITGQTDNKYIQNFGMNNDGTQASYSNVDVSSGDVSVVRLGTFANNLPSSVTIEYTKTN